MDFETLDFIADCCNPILVFALLCYISQALFKRDFQEAVLYFVSASVFLCVIYAVGWIDHVFQLWPSTSLDYSHHTTFAVAVIASFNKHILVWVLSLFAYIFLMLYQQYHSVEDIVSSALSVLIIISPLRVYFSRKYAKT